MNYLIQISVLIVLVQWYSEVKCKPFARKRHVFKSFHFELVPLPPKHFSLMLEKLTPFGKYEFKHTIKKRQILHSEIPPPVSNEIIVADEPLKVPMTHLLERAEAKDEEKLPAEVLITSVVEPLEPGKSISFLLPSESEVVITPAIKEPIPPAVEVPVVLEPKPEVTPLPHIPVVDITPKPLVVPLPHEDKHIEPNVVVISPIESTVSVPPPDKPILKEPEVPNIKNPEVSPVVTPILNSIPLAPFLYTNIKGIPFFTPAANVIPFITPGTPFISPGIPFPEAIIPSPPPVIKEIPPVIKEIPPVIKEEPPVIKEIIPVIKEEPPIIKEEIPVVVKEPIPPVVKEEPPPNFFVKSSRFVLYFGSMMLQMLSRFVNGQANINQIPFPPPFPGI